MEFTVNNGDTSSDLWEVGGITGSLSVTSVSHNCEQYIMLFHSFFCFVIDWMIIIFFKGGISYHPISYKLNDILI